MNFEVITRGWPEVDMAEGFRYRSKYSIEGGLIWFEFYRTNWWLAMTGEMAQVPELISADGSGVIWFRRLSAAMDANEIGWLFG